MGLAESLLKASDAKKFKITIAPADTNEPAASLVLEATIKVGEDENSADLHVEIVGME